jgi:hypothetical protein
LGAAAGIADIHGATFGLAASANMPDVQTLHRTAEPMSVFGNVAELAERHISEGHIWARCSPTTFGPKTCRSATTLDNDD